MSKLPPYGRHLAVPPQIRFVMLYINVPQCWLAAKHDQSVNQFNHLVLPDIKEASRYRWPVQDRIVVAIDFNASEQSEVEHLIAVLAEAGADQVTVKQMPTNQITAYCKEEQESVA